MGGAVCVHTRVGVSGGGGVTRVCVCPSPPRVPPLRVPVSPRGCHIPPAHGRQLRGVGAAGHDPRAGRGTRVCVAPAPPPLPSSFPPPPVPPPAVNWGNWEHWAVLPRRGRGGSGRAELGGPPWGRTRRPPWGRGGGAARGARDRVICLLSLGGGGGDSGGHGLGKHTSPPTGLGVSGPHWGGLGRLGRTGGTGGDWGHWDGLGGTGTDWADWDGLGRIGMDWGNWSGLGWTGTDWGCWERWDGLGVLGWTGGTGMDWGPGLDEGGTGTDWGDWDELGVLGWGGLGQTGTDRDVLEQLRRGTGKHWGRLGGDGADGDDWKRLGYTGMDWEVQTRQCWDSLGGGLVQTGDTGIRWERAAAPVSLVQQTGVWGRWEHWWGLVALVQGAAGPAAVPPPCP